MPCMVGTNVRRASLSPAWAELGIIIVSDVLSVCFGIFWKGCGRLILLFSSFFLWLAYLYIRQVLNMRLDMFKALLYYLSFIGSDIGI